MLTNKTVTASVLYIALCLPFLITTSVANVSCCKNHTQVFSNDTKFHTFPKEQLTAENSQHPTPERFRHTLTRIPSTDAHSFAPSTENIRIAHNQILSTVNISQCLHGNLSLNLTAADEITISYFHHKKKTNWVGAEFTTYYQEGVAIVVPSKVPNDIVGSSDFQYEVEPSRSQRKTTPSYVEYGYSSSQSTPGQCSLLIDSPPGRVLSVLILNQTCSSDYEVRVEDVFNDDSTVFNGCVPWKAPGYDVTTSNMSATLVIDVQDLTAVFSLQIHVRAVAPPVRDKSVTRFVTPVLGYIQTQGWHPVSSTFAYETYGTAAVTVPWNHTALISVVYMLSLKSISSPRDSPILADLTKVMNYEKEPKVVWELTMVNARPGAVLLSTVREFRLTFFAFSARFFSGTRALFSLHQLLLAPHRIANSGGLWNCSHPSWNDFHLHFLCNSKTECAGREDEAECPDTSCQQGGVLLEGTCYFHVVLEIPSWPRANVACKRHGAAMATFTTVASWYHLALIMQTSHHLYNGWDKQVTLGLRSADASLSHMYQCTRQWEEGSIAHFTWYFSAEPPPTCGYISLFALWLFPCGTVKFRKTDNVLCQATSSYDDGVSKNSIGEKKSYRKRVQFHSYYETIASKTLPFPSISCPDQHRTQIFLACDSRSECWLDDDARYTAGANVTTGYSVESMCQLGGDAMFTCQNSAVLVPYSLVCDHLQDCFDNSDENFCVFPLCTGITEYRCVNGQCVPYTDRCNGLLQCVDGTDESDCTSDSFTHHPFWPPRPQLVNFDGRGSIDYTPLTTRREEGGFLCSDTHLFCPADGFCVPVYVRCNGVLDCPGHEDEVDCNSHTCPGFYRCRGLLNTCLHPDHLCDGWPQCSQHDDERFCNLTCPAGCVCLGHAFTCASLLEVDLFTKLRYLDASGTGLQPGSLSNNLMLVYLNLAQCDLRHLNDLSLPNLISLDLNGNLLRSFTTMELNGLQNLRNLSLAKNPVVTLFSENRSSLAVANEVVIHVDLSGVKLQKLDARAHLPFPNLQSVNLSNSGLSVLVADGFQTLTSLTSLDLRGCSVEDFPRDVFRGLTKLRRVFADNFKLCCPATLPVGFNKENCEAPFNEVTSCEALLRSDVYRAFLSVLAVLSLTGNLGCFFLRMFALTGSRAKTGYSVFVIHLCVSDFVMGVYLAVIGMADRLYLGNYLWEDSSWRHSAVCQAAGVLALLSSEVSALIICLITLDRFLVIRFPFSGVRFSSVSAQVASCTTWAAGVTLVVVPLTHSSWRFYGQSGICVPLPINTIDLAGDQYAFGVMILLNLVLFFFIAVGQISVYLSMTSTAMISNDSTRKSRDVIVARRLLTVVVSDFLCWFPLGLLGVLAARGVPIPGEVNVAMAIFVMPLNSALNPFLYTLNVIQEKRRRAKEAKLLKLITDQKMKEDL